MTTTTTNSQKSAPLYVQLAQAIMLACQERGLQPQTDDQTETGFPQNKGYFFVRFGQGLTAALIVPKSVAKVGLCDSHVDLSGLDGYVPLRKENGKVLCHFDPSVGDVTQVIERLIGASKRDTRTPVRLPAQKAAAFVAAAPAEVPAIAPPTDTYGAEELASWEQEMPAKTA